MLWGACRAAVGVAAVVALVGGCSSTVEGEAVRPAGNDGLFDPCTAIPDDVISSLGVDVSTEENGVLGVRQAEFEICTWMGNWYQLGVWSTFHTLDDVRRNPEDTDIQDVPEIGDGAITFREGADVDGDLCFAALPVKQGAIFVRIDAKYQVRHEEDICGLAIKDMIALREYLPK
ncbi:DUF3558 domain-containing protein [Rhodococcus sp. OK302]|uniref:DUF3558 domain-containing protein n=1 Tax=Rhodococcus sp. OK302 TaxID=1882769 RepID=UPI000B93E4AB|nr:DUF3558 domain-containing protein [Rhodococcus sp. OK302]OYD71367.1 uncharacterized protein DUF3558 [Rhodococcus sp. OK302]